MAPEPVVAPETKPAPKVPFGKWGRVALIVLGAVLALLLLFVILERIAPGLLDPLLYSKEELEILRY